MVLLTKEHTIATFLLPEVICVDREGGSDTRELIGLFVDLSKQFQGLAKVWSSLPSNT